ncbi:hypothetical protein AUJ87_03050 [Candidatus Gracilibacteria bacterium CG1_02_38_174]|nr:MAG: hypothetical protein AUJ87_03050 [Candidatus Gracilibacteria bacterium CG1_02_38_174]
MLAKFTEFFLENRKITIALIVIIALFGALSYVLLPKQYNPSIVAPAFNVEVPTPGYTSSEASQFVAKTVENKIKELQGVDKIYSYSMDGFTSVMVAFKVGVDQEVAKTRLYDKMYSNYDLRPFGISDVKIKSIDPEDLPQVSFALTYSGTDIDSIRIGKYLRSVAVTIREELKQVPGTTVMDVLGGYKSDISIELDRQKIEAANLDMGQIMKQISLSFAHGTVGNISGDSGKISVSLDTELNSIDSVKNLLITTSTSFIKGGGEAGGFGKIYLRDIATIRSGPMDITSYYSFAEKESSLSGSLNTVFIGVAKLKGTNSVVVVDSILKKMEEIEKTLPKNIIIHTIQNEGETAREATSELMLHLFVSIAIVFIILVIFLGIKDALNAAFCIPMVLGIVFIVALVLGLDINRITLFALILSLGILVDDSIVMVENNSRHLAMMARTGRTKIEAILDSVREVGVSIVFSTITRVMSFVAMFAVTGMMGDYMKPIPVFASIALTASLFVAFSLNPFLAISLHNDKKKGNHEHKEGKFLAWYGRFLGKYINESDATVKKRTMLKLGFWIALFAILVAPIMLDIFKARMLPKADKNQVYLWIDAPREMTAQDMKKIGEDASNFLLCKTEKVSKEFCLTESVSTSVGDRFLGDFANLFRGGTNRTQENQISMRINLEESKFRDMKSEAYVIAIRPLLRAYLLQKYPDLKLRLLEDPPGPPTMATFHIKAKGQEDLTSGELARFADALKSVVVKIAPEQQIVDITDSNSSTYKQIRVKLDTERIGETGLSVPQVSATIQGFLNPSSVSMVHQETNFSEVSKEEGNVIVGFPRSERQDITTLKALTFTNPNGEKIRLDDIAQVDFGESGREIYTDNRAETVHIYAEIGENSVVYPVLKLYGLYGDKDFETLGYKKVDSSPYGIDFVGIKDGKKYRLEWGGEWELTMDTFRDLGLAMIFSLLGIYFLIVAQFRSFMIGGIVMTTFLLSFFGIFPGFSILYLISGTYFTATAMIGAIALGGIVVGNAIILLDYINQLIRDGKSLEFSVIEGSKKRFIPVMLTSVAAVAGSFIITGDPVWSGLAWSIIWGLSASAVLTLFFIPVFYYVYLRKYHRHDVGEIQLKHIVEHEREMEK